MLVIYLYDAVHGYQIQQLFIFLSKWNFKKFKNIMFYKKKTFKIVGSAAKVENERNISEKNYFPDLCISNRNSKKASNDILFFHIINVFDTHFLISARLRRI